MRAGQRGRAIAAYRQARRYLGPDPFLEANLAYAVGNQPPLRHRPLIEYLLFWQDWISYPAKFQLAACGVGITLALAVAALFVRRRLLTRAMLAGLALSLVLIVSAAYDWYRYAVERPRRHRSETDDRAQGKRRKLRTRVDHRAGRRRRIRSGRTPRRLDLDPSGRRPGRVGSRQGRGLVLMVTC